MKRIKRSWSIKAVKLFYLADNWTEVHGPEGASAIGGGSPFDNLSWSDWDGKGRIFLERGWGLPGKLYKDSGRLPSTNSRPPSSGGKASLFKAGSTCVHQSPNDIRYSMVNHMADTTLHSLADTAAAFLTLGPAASGKLPFTLVGALNQVYESHAYDPILRHFTRVLLIWHRWALLMLARP